MLFIPLPPGEGCHAKRDRVRAGKEPTGLVPALTQPRLFLMLRPIGLALRILPLPEGEGECRSQFKLAHYLGLT